MKKLLSFIYVNKVFFSGLAASLTITLQQYFSAQTTDWKAIGFACLMTVLSYLANQWRGQGVTITGVVGTLSSVFVTNYSGGHVNWNQFILLSIAAILAAVAPPAKGQGYEEHPAIKQAKE